MSESPRELAAVIIANEAPWTDGDAATVANAYLELLPIALAAWDATDNPPDRDAFNRLCSLLERLPSDWPDALRAAEEPAA